MGHPYIKDGFDPQSFQKNQQIKLTPPWMLSHCQCTPPTVSLLPEEEAVGEVAQSCPTLCNPMECSLPGSSVHGIFQARVLEWVAIAFSGPKSSSRILAV